jgi:cytochrome c5
MNQIKDTLIFAVFLGLCALVLMASHALANPCDDAIAREQRAIQRVVNDQSEKSAVALERAVEATNELCKGAGPSR